MSSAISPLLLKVLQSSNKVSAPTSTPTAASRTTTIPTGTPTTATPTAASRTTTTPAGTPTNTNLTNNTFGNSTIDQGIVNLLSEFLQKSQGLNNETIKKVLPSILESQRIAAQNNINSSTGNLLQAQMAAASNATNINQQMSSLAQRQALNAQMNQVEQFTYAEMVREKLFNLFADMEKQRMDNAFQRAKTAVQSMKY